MMRLEMRSEVVKIGKRKINQVDGVFALGDIVDETDPAKTEVDWSEKSGTNTDDDSDYRKKKPNVKIKDKSPKDTPKKDDGEIKNLVKLDQENVTLYQVKLDKDVPTENQSLIEDKNENCCKCILL